MAYKVNSIIMPNRVDEIQFFGQTFYGACTTSASTQRKTVTITGFSSSNLVDGTRIVVRFQYGNTANSPTLSVTGTSAKNISIGNSTASAWDFWRAGEVVPMVYYNNKWVIESGELATTSAWGKTKLSNTITNDSTTALTPSAVYSAGFATTSQIPTDTSDLTNNAGFITLADLPIYNGGVI